MTNQEKLLSAFKEKRIEDFRKLVKHGDIDVDYFYGEPDNGTLLDLASRSQENEGYVYLLIKNGAKAWHKDEETGKFELHEIFKYYDLCRVFWRAVLDSSRPEKEHPSINILKIAVEENDIDVIELLAHSYSEELEAFNFYKNLSFTEHSFDPPIVKHLILLEGSIDAVRVFIKYFDLDMEFQKDSQGRVFSCRELILQKFPELEAELPIRALHEFPKILYASLENGAHESFVRQIAVIADEVTTEILNKKQIRDSNAYTCLHLACERNYIDVVDALLQKNVPLNERTWFNKDHRKCVENVTPIMVAAHEGCYEVFQKLFIIPDVELQNEEGSGSVLHQALHGMQLKQYENLSTDSHLRILELILEVREFTYKAELLIPEYRLDIERTDEDNRTALHYALKYNNKFAVKLLLGAGAKLYPRDQSILTSISATIIESSFDDCIRYETSADAVDNEIIFRYKIFTQLNLHSIAMSKSEGNFFIRLESVTEMRKLYKHPLTKSLLYAKWCLVKKYYYINLAFYLSFCLALNAYIFLIQDCLPSSGKFNGSGSIDTATIRDASSIECDVPLWVWWLITLPLYIVLILRELCQFSVSIRSYLGIPENWLEMTMIVVIGFLFANDTNRHLAASAILTSWIGLILLLGKQPSLSIYIEMFKTVALNFAKFLLLYSILIASFAFSFFILFRNKPSEQSSSQNRTDVKITDRTNENSMNLWQDLQTSFLKSIIMMTGEFDASTLPLDSNFGYGHVFFILFIFLVTMVLYSLLNGLAVSDTRLIMDDAEVVALMSRAKLITQIERLAKSNPFRHAFKCRTTKQLGRVYKFVRNKLFGDMIFLEEHAVFVYPAKNNRMESTARRMKSGKMPSSIVKPAEEILEKRKQSELAKNKKSLTNVTKNHSSEHQSVNDSVHAFGRPMSDLKLEIDDKIAVRDEKLLRNFDQRFDKMMNEVLNKQTNNLKIILGAENAVRDENLLQNINQRFDRMKLEIDAKNVARDEKLLQNVDQRFDKINKLLESVLQEANLLKKKN